MSLHKIKNVNFQERNRVNNKDVIPNKIHSQVTQLNPTHRDIYFIALYLVSPLILHFMYVFVKNKQIYSLYYFLPSKLH